MQRQIKTKIKEYRTLPIIIFVAVVLRFMAIDLAPASLNWDEISHGYNAYSILKTGKDEWGQTLPLIFRAYGDFKLPVYIYLTAISEFFLGLTALSVRLPSILAGVSTVIFTYLLTRKFFENKIAILASFLVAVEPWSFFLSRGAFEANLSLAFIVAGVYFFVSSAKSNKWYLPLSAVLLGLSVWTYNSARIFVPLLLISLIIIYKTEIRKLFKKSSAIVYASMVAILVFFAPMGWQLVNPEGQARYEWVAILDEGAILTINQQRGSLTYAPTINHLIANKGTYFANKFATNYLSHFTPSFLFTEGGSQYQFSVPGHGLVYLVNAPFVLIGLIEVIRRRDKVSRVLISWLVLAPIPSALTREAPHVLRSIVLLPIPMILSAIGVYWVWERLKTTKIIFLIGYIAVLFISVEGYLMNYFSNYRVNFSWSWQYGYSQVVDYVKTNYEDYDKIVVTKKYGEPHEFFLFYWPWEPENYINNSNLVRFYQSKWYWIDAFDKFNFVNDWDIAKTENNNFVLESGGVVDCNPVSVGQSVKCLLITSPGNYPAGWVKIETINFLDESPAFEILEN